MTGTNGGHRREEEESQDYEGLWGYAPPCDRQLHVNGRQFETYKRVSSGRWGPRCVPLQLESCALCLARAAARGSQHTCVLCQHRPRRQRRSLLWLPVASPVGGLALAWGLVTTITDLTYTAFLVGSRGAQWRSGDLWTCAMHPAGALRAGALPAAHRVDWLLPRAASCMPT